jgi:hypothetical protein
LDVLGLDRSGRLVVAELKRDRAPDTVEMQAIKYAAMASRFTPDVVASQYAAFLHAAAPRCLPRMQWPSSWNTWAASLILTCCASPGSS